MQDTGLLYRYTLLSGNVHYFMPSHQARHMTGCTNAFHVATSTEFARCYNDVSVLENHHCALTCDLLSKAKLLAHLDKSVQQVSR